MTTTFVHDGEALDHTPAVKVTAGDVLELGGMLTVAKKTTPADTLGAFHVSGVFDFPKTAAAGTGGVAGVAMFWDTVAKAATAIASATTKLLGYAVRLTGDADTTARIKLMQSGGMIAATASAAEGLEATLAAGNTTGTKVIDVNSTGRIDLRDGSLADPVIRRKTPISGVTGMYYATSGGLGELNFVFRGTKRIRMLEGELYIGALRALFGGNFDINAAVGGTIRLGAALNGQIQVNGNGTNRMAFQQGGLTSIQGAKFHSFINGVSPPPAAAGSSPGVMHSVGRWLNYTSGVREIPADAYLHHWHQEYLNMLVDAAPFLVCSDGPFGTDATRNKLFVITREGGLGIGGESFGSGKTVLFLANATTVPSSNPTAGGVIYAEAGALKFRGSSGTITVLGAA